MDRPSRKTKVVNYFENKDLVDDEDFACSKAPPSKKPREETRNEQKKSSFRSSSQETNQKSTQSDKSRKPLDVKLYERDLEAAITLSLLNKSDELNESPTTDVKVQSPMDENTDPASLLLSNCSVDGAVLGLDEITSEKASPAATGRRTASTKPPEVQRKKEDDGDYNPGLAPDSESDDDFSEPSESEDEEFTVRKATKAKRTDKVIKKEKNKTSPTSRKEKKQTKPSTKQQAAAVSSSERSSPAGKVAPRRPASSSAASTVKPVSSVSPAGGRIPKWNPPAQISESPTSSQSPGVKSPSAGLRLGLSRLVRVKPLHPSVASH